MPPVPCLPKYTKLVKRIWDILESHRIVVRQSDTIIRGVRTLEFRDASHIQQTLRTRFPAYDCEANLIGLTGPRLADCLSGKIDPISLMFGNPSSLRIMEEFYAHSPMMATLTQQLIKFLTTQLETTRMKEKEKIRILEVGAGTGGTTIKLAEALEAANIAVQYTFTDISPRLVVNGKKKLQKYPWMDFATFNVEQEVTSTFKDQFDIVISTNCIHATTNKVASCRRLGETLKSGGFVVLSEVTRVLDWYDICFGLFDGWWLAEGGATYPLQPAQAWMSTFREAGFKSMSFSHGPTPEATTQQLLVCCKENWENGSPVTPISSTTYDGAYKLQTMMYKEVDGVQIHADVYLPRDVPNNPMSIALMIHGGGHMTLSRKAVRPAQTKHLLSNGFLPVSVDYRLCPEVDIVAGAFTDVLDAYSWARLVLPGKLYSQGIVIDNENTVVIGWSTGGHLAMSICWMTRGSSIPSPTAVLSFYAPTDFESGELDSCRLAMLPERCISMERTLEVLPTKPITNYDFPSCKPTTLGLVRPGDPRSELVLSLFKEGIGLPLLLNGLPTEPDTNWLENPSSSRIAAISPLARLRQGDYNTPTYIIHSTEDEIVPFAAAERFVAALKERGIKSGFLKLSGVKHIHDLHLRPRTKEWDDQVAPGYDFLFDAVSEARTI